MSSDELAAAVERLLTAIWIRSQHADEWPKRDVTAVVKHLANAYLAREADDAKPVDREWLVSVLGEPSRNGVWYHELASDPQRRHEIEIMLRGDICGDLLCAESPQSATVSLTTRKKLRAFLELADWPTNETNGGE